MRIGGTRSGGRRLGFGLLPRSFVDVHQHPVIAEPQHVTGVQQHARAAPAQRCDRIIHVGAVAAGVLEEVFAAAEMDVRVAAGEVARHVGQGPVVVQRAADAAAGFTQHETGMVAKLLTLSTDYFKAQSHAAGTFDDQAAL